MSVLDLLDEIEEIVDTAGGVPLTNKIMVDANELLEIVKEIRQELPEEFQQAKWLKDQRERILKEAQDQYEKLVKDAEEQAARLVDNHEITQRAQAKSEEIMRATQENVRTMKMSTFDYIDSILFNFQEKMDEMNAEYFGKMFDNLEQTFTGINATLAENREEIKNMAFRTQNGEE